MLRLRFARFAVLGVALSLAASGCATTGAVGDGEDEVSANQEAATEAPQGPGGPGFRHGPHRGNDLVFVALHELDLSAEQRATIEASLADGGEKDRAHIQAVGKVLAAGVRAGKVDEAAVKAKLDELGAPDHRAKRVKMLNTLHATLTPAQREALVAKVSEMGKGHGPQDRPMGPPPDQANEAKDAKGAQPEGRGPRGGHGRMGGMGPMGFFLHDLNLSDAQREKIRAALEDARPDKPSEEEMTKMHEEMRARHKAVLDAFKGASFDAAKVLPEKAMEPPVQHLVKGLNLVLPELDATQKEALAVRLEQGPPERPMGERMGPPPGGPAREHKREAR